MMSTSSEPTIFQQLAAPLPPEAIEMVAGDESGDFTSIRTSFVIERLNDVLGPNSWKAKYLEISSRVNSSNEISLKCIVESEKHGLYAEGYGSHQDHDRIGNAYKGAKSTALKNAVLLWGIGLEVHKGLPEENLDSGRIPDHERIKKSIKTGKLIWTSASGVISESQSEENVLWLQVNGWTCRAVTEIAADLYGKEGWKTMCQGYWQCADGIAFVILTRLISIMELEPLVVPKIKKEKPQTEEVAQ